MCRYHRLSSVHLMKVEKIDFFAKNSNKFVYHNENMNKQFSRKPQRFKTRRKNKTKNTPFFVDFSNIYKMTTFSHWTGPIKVAMIGIIFGVSNAILFFTFKTIKTSFGLFCLVEALSIVLLLIENILDLLFHNYIP
jgi:hypothetical protein